MSNQIDKNRMCIGIDLGTTNTTVCVSRVDTNGVILLEDCEIRQRSEQNERNQDRLPSIMYVKSEGKEVVGHEARELKKASITSAEAEAQPLVKIDNPSKKRLKIYFIDNRFIDNRFIDVIIPFLCI